MIKKTDIKELSAEFEISTYEAYRILLEEERNDILKEAFGINSSHKPTFIEAIGMALGVDNSGLHTTINDNVGIIADNVDTLGSLLEKLNEKYSA